MAQTTHLPIYKVAYDLLGLVTDLLRNMPRDSKQTIGIKINQECVEIANEIRRRGHSVKADLTKTYRRSISA